MMQVTTDVQDETLYLEVRMLYLQSDTMTDCENIIISFQ